MDLKWKNPESAQLSVSLISSVGLYVTLHPWHVLGNVCKNCKIWRVAHWDCGVEEWWRYDASKVPERERKIEVTPNGTLGAIITIWCHAALSNLHLERIQIRIFELRSFLSANSHTTVTYKIKFENSVRSFIMLIHIQHTVTRSIVVAWVSSAERSIWC